MTRRRRSCDERVLIGSNVSARTRVVDGGSEGRGDERAWARRSSSAGADGVALQRQRHPQPWKPRRSTDQLVAAVAARQHGIVGRNQLLALWFTEGEIRWRVGSDRLFPAFVGAYAVGTPATRIEAIRMAALLSIAPSFVSHRDAVESYGLWQPIPGPVHVTVAHGRSVRRVGIVIHRTRHLHPDERRAIGPLRITSPARSLVDVSGDCSRRQLTRAFDEAMRLRCATRAEVLAACARSAGRPGTAALVGLARAEVIPLDRTRSRPEARFLRFSVDHALPVPLVNVPLLGYEVDFLWPEAKLVIELDGSHHDSARARARDGARDARLEAAGYAVRRVRPAQVRTSNRRLAERILGAIREPQRG